MENAGFVTSYRYLVTLAILAATMAAARLASGIEPTALVHPLDSIPASIGPWTAAGEETLSENELSILQPSSYLLRSYRLDEPPPGSAAKPTQMQLLVVYYARQQVGQSMHSPKNCLPGSWEVRASGTAVVPVGAGRQARVNTYAIQRDEQKQLILYWYESKGWLAASEFTAKFYLLRDTVAERRSPGALIRLDFPDQPGALEAGESFAAAVIPQIRRCLE